MSEVTHPIQIQWPAQSRPPEGCNKGKTTARMPAKCPARDVEEIEEGELMETSEKIQPPKKKKLKTEKKKKIKRKKREEEDLIYSNFDCNSHTDHHSYS